MANEKRGDFSEAALVAALKSIGYQLDLTLFWRQTPRRLTVCDSDVTLGSNPDEPDALFQVCSSGYEGGYQKKFWRDLGELIEVKRMFPACKVISVVFEPGAKERLIEVSAFCGDGVIQVSGLKGGPALLKDIAILADESSARSKEAKLAQLETRVATSQIASLAAALRATLARAPAIWRLEHTPPTTATSMQLNFRRAILISALFSQSGDFSTIKPFLQAAHAGRALPKASFHRALENLGVCRRGLGGGYWCNDSNLVSCLREVGPEAFAQIALETLSENSKSRLTHYVEQIHALPDLVPKWFNALIERFDSLLDPVVLARALQENYRNFALFLPRGTAVNEPWLFRRLLDLVRAADDKHFAIGIPKFDPHFVAAGLQPLRFLVSDYVAGKRPLAPREAEVAAEVLAIELLRIRPKVTLSLHRGFWDKVLRSEFQQRLITYRGFDPLPAIIRRRFGGKSTTYVPEIVRGLGIVGAATTSVFLEDGRLAMFQSASKEGVAHKVKENVGRMGLCCLRVSESRGRRTFSFAPELKERVLYIDGEWKESDIRALYAGGFTEVRRLI